MTTVRTRTRRQPPAVQPVSKPSVVVDLLEQGVCTHRTDFDELERRLYLSSDPAHWQQATLISHAQDATEYRIYADIEERHGDLDERNRERLALRSLVRKLVEHMHKPLEVTITLDAKNPDDNGVERKDQDELDELLEHASEVMDDFSVHQLEDGEKKDD
jgi:hypothetical protein